MAKNRIAVALGKLAAGVPKTMSAAERKRRGERGAQYLRDWHRRQGHKIKSAV